MDQAPVHKMVRSWFSAKQAEITANARLAVVQHGGLIGSHREHFQREFLRQILPSRFSVGRGVVSGLVQQSTETDIVVWDSANYVCLPISDHALFFAESVRSTVEVKSNWSIANFEDICRKTKSVRDIVPMRSPEDANLADELDHMWLEIQSLKSGRAHDGRLISQHHIGCASVVLSGGTTAQLADLLDSVGDRVDETFPDLLLLLDSGTLFVKEYDPPVIYHLDFGTDALMVFAHLLLQLTLERSVRLEGAINLGMYLPFDIGATRPTASAEYSLTRWPPGREVLWRDS
jgi:hypothetical protein